MLRIISISPLNENVCVRRDEATEEVSPGGLVLPQSEPPQTGVIEAISADVPEGVFSVGDRVLFDRLLVADEVETSTGKRIVMHYSNLKAIISVEENDWG